MVNLTKYVLTVICATHLASTQQEYRDENGNIKDCSKYEEAWRIAKCAASQKEGELISNKLFSYYLQIALRKVPSSTAYTSVGFTTGVERELVVGKQSHADFDQWMYTVTYDPRAMYRKRAILSMQKEYMKPVLFFSKTVPDSVPFWDDLLIPSLRLAGNGMDFFVYKSKDAAPFKTGAEENCAAFYEWESRESFEEALGNVMIMDPSLWCPAMDSARFDIVVGDLEEIKVTNLAGEVQFQTIWELTKTGQIGGRMDHDYKSFF